MIILLKEAKSFADKSHKTCQFVSKSHNICHRNLQYLVIHAPLCVAMAIELELFLSMYYLIIYIATIVEVKHSS